MRLRALVARMPPSSLQGLYLQRPAEVFTHRPVASNKHQFGNDISSIAKYQSSPMKPIPEKVFETCYQTNHKTLVQLPVNPKNLPLPNSRPRSASISIFFMI